jgi:peptidoglycan/LPS O-acetylase OafA/YrhL
MQQRREPIPALTGLRFVAAFFVLLGHMLPKVMPFADPPKWYVQISSVAAEGMTLFFVLSGFVIHYNYSARLSTGGMWGLRNFFAARFARLYPLYFVVLAYQLIFSFSYSQLPQATAKALPYYLLMVQTWFYWPLGKYGLIDELGILPAVAWSISTEWFFYMVYPLARIVVARLVGIRARLWLGVVLGVVIGSAIIAASLNASALNQFGIERFGAIGDSSVQMQYSMFRWLVYFSPYSRIFEFLLGCICASIFMTLKERKVSSKEEQLGFVALLATIVVTAVIHWVMFGPANKPNDPCVITQFHMCFGFAPSMVIIIFCCARYNNIISRTLSSWPLVLCGEASYSLYLLHLLIVMAFRWESAPVSSFIVGVGDFLRVVVAVFSAIGLSLITWRIVEVPARRWVRNALMSAPGLEDAVSTTGKDPGQKPDRLLVSQ